MELTDERQSPRSVAVSSHRANSSEPPAASDEPLRLLIECVKDYAIIVLDTTGRIQTWNRGAERIKGWSAEEIIGESFERFYPKEAVDSGYPQHELRVAAREGRFEDEGWRVRKDGSRFWANVIITALKDQSGNLVGFGKVTRDLTARREAEAQARQLAAEEAAREEATRKSEELQRLNAELEAAVSNIKSARDQAELSAAQAMAAYRELDQFAYVASHDLKAPLRGIANLAQWLQDDLGESLPEESAEHMRLLQGRVRRMEALIDAILAYSRVGRVRTPAERLETGDVVREAIDLLAPPAEVELHVASDLPIVESERVPLEQVFMNLLSNAIKYTVGTRPDPEVRVAWRDAGDHVEFSVSDNGPGIAPEYHERIWGIFQTLAARDKVEGTGIGLALVKKTVEGRGGTVGLESDSGSGAVFRFTWPKQSGATQ
jgi:PAS domain S-box-containing protein